MDIQIFKLIPLTLASLIGPFVATAAILCAIEYLRLRNW
jgi:hypothetical protein